MNFAEQIRDDVKTYLGISTVPASEYAGVFSELIAEHSKDIFLDSEKLSDALNKKRVSEIDVLRICMITKVTGFRQLVEYAEDIWQSDMDRFVLNAEEETGLNRMVVMKLTSDIAMSLGLVFDFSKETEKRSNLIKEQAYIIPESVYLEELQECERLFINMKGMLDPDLEIKGSVDSIEFSRISDLVSTGLPRAKYYLGCCMVLGINCQKNEETGVKLLKEAARAGEIHAAAALGDYYYQQGPDNWEVAFQYYTSVGSLALNNKRQEAVTRIINHGTFNRKAIFRAAVLLVLMVLLLLIAPAAGTYAAHRVVGIFCSIGMIGVFCLSFVHFKVKPYDNTYWVFAGMFLIWCIGVATRLLFA